MTGMRDSAPESDPVLQNDVLRAIWTRRVVRDFTEQPVSDEQLRVVLESARWAPRAGNRRINRLLVIRDPDTIRRLRMVSPGILGRPLLLVVILTDLGVAEKEQVQVTKDVNLWIDVGTLAATMMLAAHALGLGTCPATSFSRTGVSTMLDLPARIVPQLILQLGNPARRRDIDVAQLPQRVLSEDFVFWEQVDTPTRSTE